MDLSLVSHYSSMLARAGVTTLVLFGKSLVLACVLGLIIACLRVYGPRPVSRACFVYSWFLRSVPLLLLLFYVFYGLPALGVQASPMTAAVLSLGITSSAYMSETFRSGLLAVPKDQVDAARSLGMPFRRIMRRVVARQAAVATIPPWTSNVVLLLQGTSLASLVTIQEITGVTNGLISQTYKPFGFLGAAAAFYLAVGGALILLSFAAERLVAGSWRAGVEEPERHATLGLRRLWSFRQLGRSTP